jgi:hypothetical protein
VTNPPNDFGTHPWVERTGGLLTAAERRRLLRPLARAHAVNAVGRVSMAVRLNSGRRAGPRLTGQRPLPDSALTRAAAELGRARLSPAMLNHSYRTYAFATALGDLTDIDVDHELLFAASLLHDVGLPTRAPHVDFTFEGERAARDVAEEVGLSTAATDTLRTAITLHHSPGVTEAHGPVAYLLSAGAALDVTGLRSWQLSGDLMDKITAAHPRLGFKREFAAALRVESARVPRGRASFLRRYGAFDLAIKVAPFRD